MQDPSKVSTTGSNPVWVTKIIIMEDKLTCPYDEDINGKTGTCDCNHENYNSCLGDI